MCGQVRPAGYYAGHAPAPAQAVHVWDLLEYIPWIKVPSAPEVHIMKQDIHPTYFHNCKVFHNGKVVMEVGATVPEMHVEVWSGSHPFFTGKQTFVDTTGRVERFQKKFAGNYFKKDEKPAAKA